MEAGGLRVKGGAPRSRRDEGRGVLRWRCGGALSSLRGGRGTAGTLARPASVAQWKSDSVLRSRLGVRVPPGAPRSAIGISPSEDRAVAPSDATVCRPPSTPSCAGRGADGSSPRWSCPGGDSSAAGRHDRGAPSRVRGRPRPEPLRSAERVREKPTRGIQRAARDSRSHGGRPQAVAVGIRDPLPRLDVAGRPPPAVRARAPRSGEGGEDISERRPPPDRSRPSEGVSRAFAQAAPP